MKYIMNSDVILWYYEFYAFYLMLEKLERNKDTLFLAFICTLDIIQPWNQ